VRGIGPEGKRRRLDQHATLWVRFYDPFWEITAEEITARTLVTAARPRFTMLREAVGLRSVHANEASPPFILFGREEENPVRQASGVAVGDFDGDGCEDLLLAGSPELSLHRNRCDGTFEDVTGSSGLASDVGACLGAIDGDFNGDGRRDLYVANDGQANQLWINRDGSRFENTALLAGCAFNRDGEAEASMGVDAADFDGDGDEDLFMTHLVDETNTLYVNNGKGWFDDSTVRTGLGSVSRTRTGFGTAWFDYDNDGWLDLVVANGAVKTIESLRRAGHPYPLGQYNQLFRNDGAGGFDDMTISSGAAFEPVDVSRGIAAGDVDNDGDTDLLIVNNSGPVRLLINEVGQDNDWIGLQVVEGTRVEVVLSDGRSIWRRSRAGGSYCSAGDPRVLVGLGSASVSAVRTHWPDGSVEEWTDVAVGEYTTLLQGSVR